MLKIYFLLPLIFFLSFSANAQNKDLTVQRNGLIFPNGKELIDPVNAKMDIPQGGSSAVYAEITGITGDVTATVCDECVEIYAFDSYLFREPQVNGQPANQITKQYFVLYKKADSASDQLIDKFRTNSFISSIAIKHFVPNINTGQSELGYTVELSNSKIAEFRLEMKYDSEFGGYFLVEKYYLLYNSLSFKEGNQPAIVLN